MKSDLLSKLSAKFVLLYQSIYKGWNGLWKDCGQVWMFHLISDMEEDGEYEKEFTIKKENLIRLVREAIEKGYHFESLEGIGRAYRDQVFLTFDDGFKEVYTIAYPILKYYNIPFCVFITTDYLGKPKYLSKEELIEMSLDELCTVGAHTLTHPKLRLLDRFLADKEIQQPKIWLETLLGKKVDFFAYPYGDFFSVSKRNRKSTLKCGYKYAFSTIQMPLNERCIKQATFIPRININDMNFEMYLKDRG